MEALEQRNGVVPYLELVRTEGITPEALQAMMNFRLLSYRSTRSITGDLDGVPGSPPFISVPSTCFLYQMRRYLRDYLPRRPGNASASALSALFRCCSRFLFVVVRSCLSCSFSSSFRGSTVRPLIFLLKCCGYGSI